MNQCAKLALGCALLAIASGAAWAQDEEPGAGGETDATAEAGPPEEESQKGKVDAGGKLRFPSGPDEMGEFGLFNWIALDLRARYGVTDSISGGLFVPLAIVRPDVPEGADEPEIFGGVLGEGSLALMKVIGVRAQIGVLQRSGWLLSQYDYPIYTGDMKFGLKLGPMLDARVAAFGSKLELSAAADVVLAFGADVDDMGEDKMLTALQVPVAALVQLSDLLKVGLTAGIYTGPEFKLGAEDGGRIPLSAAASLKTGPIYLDLGLGFASLVTSDQMGAVYPELMDSLSIGLNVRWAGK